MKVYTTRRFEKDYASLPPSVQNAVDKKLRIFIADRAHPSLRIKKMEGTQEIWEMRVSKNYRITFQFTDDLSEGLALMIFLKRLEDFYETLNQAPGLVWL